MAFRGLVLVSIGISFNLLVASTPLGMVRGFQADEIFKVLGIPFNSMVPAL